MLQALSAWGVDDASTRRGGRRSVAFLCSSCQLRLNYCLHQEDLIRSACSSTTESGDGTMPLTSCRSPKAAPLKRQRARGRPFRSQWQTNEIGEPLSPSVPRIRTPDAVNSAVSTLP